MYDLDLFQQALGLGEPWEVVEVKFDAGRRRLDLRVDFPKGVSNLKRLRLRPPESARASPQS